MDYDLWEQQYEERQRKRVVRERIVFFVVHIGVVALVGSWFWMLFVWLPEKQERERNDTLLPCESRVVKYHEGKWCIHDVERVGDDINYTLISGTCTVYRDHAQALCVPLETQ